MSFAMPSRLNVFAMMGILCTGYINLPRQLIFSMQLFAGSLTRCKEAVRGGRAEL